MLYEFNATNARNYGNKNTEFPMFRLTVCLIEEIYVKKYMTVEPEQPELSSSIR